MNKKNKSLLPDPEVGDRYLNLLKMSLTRYNLDDGYLSLHYRTHGRMKGMLYNAIEKALNPVNLELVKHNQYDPQVRKVGKDWPAHAETMIGLERLNNIEYCMKEILKHDVPGDFIETGVWRGGATIFMRGLLKVYGITNRKVWVADSFQGLPKPKADEHKQDIIDKLWSFPQLSVSRQEVEENFKKYELLDDQVKFLVGWFKDTLPNAPIRKLALVRLDGDMYDSTIDALQALYKKLSVGGYVIVDDYCLLSCRDAIRDFRKEMKITDSLIKIDWASVYWQKTKE